MLCIDYELTAEDYRQADRLLRLKNPFYLFSLAVCLGLLVLLPVAGWGFFCRTGAPGQPAWLLPVRAAVAAAAPALLLYSTGSGFVREQRGQRDPTRPTGPMRLIVADEMLRVYRQNGLQILACPTSGLTGLRWDGRSVLVMRSQVAALTVVPRRAFENEKDLQELRQTLWLRHKAGMRLPEELWQALPQTRENRVWRCEYPMDPRRVARVAGGGWAILAAVAAGFILDGALRGEGQLESIAAGALMLLVAGVMCGPLRPQQKAGAGRGQPHAGARPWRFEVYEDGVQCAQGNACGFWSWEQLRRMREKRGVLLLETAGEIIAILPREAFAGEAEYEWVTGFLWARIGHKGPCVGA